MLWRMRFVGQGIEKLEHEPNRQTDRSERINTPHSRMITERSFDSTFDTCYPVRLSYTVCLFNWRQSHASVRRPNQRQNMSISRDNTQLRSTSWMHLTTRACDCGNASGGFCVSVCLSCSCSKFWKPSKLYVWFTGSSSEYLVKFAYQGHRVEVKPTGTKNRDIRA